MKTLGYDYSDYELYKWSEADHVYRENWYTKLLIRKKHPIKENLDQHYFGKHEQPHLKNQIPFISSIEKEFYEFKLIEITSETSIKEHCTFVHPFYKGQEQFLYFSDTTDLMIERLANQRVFLYRKTPLNTGNHVRFDMVHRFHDFPLDLLEST